MVHLVEEVVLVVIDIHVAVAEFGEDVAGNVETDCGLRIPGDLRAGTESADVALRSQKQPVRDVDLPAESDDRIDPPLIAGSVRG